MINTCITIIIIVMRCINLVRKRIFLFFFTLGISFFFIISCKNSFSPYTDVTLQKFLASYDVSQLIPVDVVILSGQSNMTGLGLSVEVNQYLSEKEYQQLIKGIDDIKIFSCNDNVAIKQGFDLYPYSKVGFRNGTNGEFFGPEIGFALECLKDSQSLVLLKYAAAGMPIDYFLDDGDISIIMKAYFFNCLLDLVSQGYYPTVRAVCWMQGEGDCGFHNACCYYEKECSLIKYLRRDFDERLVFIDARVTDMQLLANDLHQDLVNNAKERIAQEDELCFLIDSTGLKKRFYDVAHYDTPSIIELGRRFAREFLVHSEAGK